MTADFKMKFDDGGTPEGLKKTADAGDKAAESLKEVGQSGAQAAESLDKATKTTDSLGKEVDQATKETQEFTASLDDATKEAKALAAAEQEAAAKAKELENANKEAREKADRAKEGFEGLQKILALIGLGGIATFAFQAKELTEGLLKLGKAIGTITLTGLRAAFIGLTAAMGPVIITAAAVGAAIYAVGQAILWLISPSKELTDALEKNDKDFENLHQGIEGVIPSITEMAGKTKELADQLKSLFDPLDQHKNEIEVKLRIADLNTVASVNARLKQLRDELNEIMSMEAITVDQIQAKEQRLSDFRKRNANEVPALIEKLKTLEEKDEADRLKAIDEKRQKQREAFEKYTGELKFIHDTNAAYDAAELKSIEERKQATLKAIEERKKKEQEAADAKKKQEDELLAKIKGRMQQSQPEQQAQSAPSASPGSSTPTEQPNKYGEGVAPTAGKKPNAFAAQANMDFGIETDFMGGANSSFAVGGDSTGKDPFVDLAEAVNKKLTAQNIKRKAIEEDMKRREKEDNEKIKQELERQFGTSDADSIDSRDSKRDFNRRKKALEDSYRDDRRQAAKGMEKNGITEDQRDDAIQKITDETTQNFAKQNKLDETKQEFYGEVTKNIVDQGNKIVSLEQVMRSFIGNLQRASNANRGSAPSNSTSRRRSSP